MKKIGIFYGSTTGTCENLAEQLANKLGVTNNDIYSADKMSTELVDTYDVLILGTSTWGDGELQDDWYDAIKVLKRASLKEKIIALCGCGDSESYCDTFCDGMGILYEDLKNTGCIFIGNKVDSSDYSFSNSRAIVDGQFVGLALDDVNESDKTFSRIEDWIVELKKNI